MLYIDVRVFPLWKNYPLCGIYSLYIKTAEPISFLFFFAFSSKLSKNMHGTHFPRCMKTELSESPFWSQFKGHNQHIMDNLFLVKLKYMIEY